MSKVYLVNGRCSETPIYWTAHYPDCVINQINDDGCIDKKWSNLPLEELQYWGVISNVGCYGFYPKDGICNLNGTKLRIESSQGGKVSYRRTIVASSQGWTRTKSAEICLGDYAIVLHLFPETQIVFGRQQELTGQCGSDLE